MKMIVGLGNIGPQYKKTRHNTGFIILDSFATRIGFEFSTQKMNAKLAHGQINNEKVLLVKPTTFMNESGNAVISLINFYKLGVNDFIIIQDDMDLSLGQIRFRDKGSAGGHNGIKSIIEELGTSHFGRLKVGISHPIHQSVVKHVLGKFDAYQQEKFDRVQDKSVQALIDWINGATFLDLMNQYN